MDIEEEGQRQDDAAGKKNMLSIYGVVLSSCKKLRIPDPYTRSVTVLA